MTENKNLQGLARLEGLAALTTDWKTLPSLYLFFTDSQFFQVK